MSGPDGERLCSSCGEPNPVRAKYCMECGTKLGAAEELGERRILTVLFADLSGFTAFSEGSDVEDVHALAQEAADRLSEIVDRYGGTVDKIIGDCVMAVWGAPETHEDDAERAVRAALDMQTVVANRSERFFGLRLSTGLYTGEAIWAPIGPDGRYTALGDTVNTAARLQGAAGKGEIYVGQETHRATKDVIEYQEIEPVKAKNKAEPVLAWNAIGVKGQRRAAVELPMVGRHAELERLWELWELVRTERTPYLAAVTGAPGIGKSRLIRRIAERVEGDADVWWGRCLDYGEGITYWPVIEAVKAAAGILHDDIPEAVSRKLGALLESLGSDDLDELRTMAVSLANLVAAPTTPRGTYSATEISQGELHWGIRRVFQLLARKRPVVLVFEDLHWAEPVFLDLLRSFVDMTDQAPILLIASARPELDPQTLADRRKTRRIDVDVLDETESGSLVAHMLGSAEIEGALADLISSAAGNPLFLEETVRMLMDAGALDQEGHVIPDKVASLSIPSNVRALIGTRLDRTLSGLQKRTAGRASVIGETFWSGAISYVEGAIAADPDVHETEVDRVLAELEDRDVVAPRATSTIAGQHEWAFRHALIREVVYQRIPKNQRIRLHARCGEWLAALPGGSDELVEIVAHHLEQACLLAREVTRTTFSPPVIDAVRALTRAADKAEAREGIREANRFCTRALDLLNGSFPETSVKLRLRRARMMTALGSYDEAFEEFTRVADLSDEIGRPELRCQALMSLTELDMMMGRISDARQKLEAAERLAAEVGDPELRIRTTWHRATLDKNESPTASERHLRSAIAMAEEIENTPLILASGMRLGVHFYNTGNLAEAEAELQRCVDLAKAQGSLRYLSWSTAFLGMTRFHRGPRDQAAKDLAQAADWHERMGDRFMMVQALVWLANLDLLAGNVRNAVRLMRIAAPLAGDTTSLNGARVCRTLVDALVRQDRVAEAREIIEAESERPEEPGAHANLLMAEAAVAAADGDDAGVRQRFALALPLLAGETIDVGEALLLEARLLASVGDKESAHNKLLEAREIFEAVGGLATIGEIDETIEQIAPSAQVLRFGTTN